MPLLDIKITTKKNGQQVAWFRDDLKRRVGTRLGIDKDRAAIVTAEQLRALAELYIDLQQDQLEKGIGSSGSPMPPLSGKQVVVFDRTGGKPKFVERLHTGYRGKKIRKGLPGIRDLYGPEGQGGHMRDDIRINYLDDQIAKVSISRKSSRDKALANERKAPWWGLTPANARVLAQAQANVFGGAMEDYLDSLGLVQSGNYIVQLAKRLNSMKRSLGRTAA